MAAAVGVGIPDSFVGNTEETAQKLLQTAQKAGAHLARKSWRALTFEHNLTTIPGTLEYPLPDNPAFDHFKSGTGFDRTQYRSLTGPEPAELWQQGEALLVVTGGLEHRFRIKRDPTTNPREDKLFLLDDPAGAYDLAFEYVTKEWLYDGSGAYRSIIGADTDQPVFDPDLYELEITWRVLRSVGEAYFDEKDEAIRTADNLYGQENGKTVRMAKRRLRYEVNIPEGDWI